MASHPFHDQAALNRRFVPFASLTELPVLACIDLAVFKAFFGRPKDAIDVAAMAATGAINLDSLQRQVGTLLGDDAQRADFFRLAASSVSDYKDPPSLDPMSPLTELVRREQAGDR